MLLSAADLAAVGLEVAVDSLVTSFAPAFACGLALQRLLELADPILDAIAKGRKKLVVSLIALAVGIAFAASANLRVLERLGVADKDVVDFAVTALLVSAGTDGFNSLFKFLGYAKEQKKAAAAAAQGTDTAGIQKVV
jgi:hypothetical protein